MDEVEQKMLIDLGEAAIATAVAFGIGWGDPQKQAITTLFVALVTFGTAVYNHRATKQIVMKAQAMSYHAGYDKALSREDHGGI